MFRIQDKENITLNGNAVTAYKIFEKIEDDTGYMLIGNGYCDGHNATDRQCINDWLDSNPDDLVICAEIDEKMGARIAKEYGIKGFDVEEKQATWIKDYIEGCRANGVDPAASVIEYSNCEDAEVTEEGVWACGAWWDTEKIAAFRQWVEQ
jgi:hypothetical protein